MLKMYNNIFLLYLIVPELMLLLCYFQTGRGYQLQVIHF